MKPFQSSPAFTLCYDFLRWLIPVTQAFPRSHRFGIAQELMHHAFALQECLFAAVHTSIPIVSLAQADVHLAMLRTLIRLSYDLNLLRDGSSAHGQQLLHQMGKIVGAWQKRLALDAPDRYNSAVSL